MKGHTKGVLFDNPRVKVQTMGTCKTRAESGERERKHDSTNGSIHHRITLLYFLWSSLIKTHNTTLL